MREESITTDGAITGRSTTRLPPAIPAPGPPPRLTRAARNAGPGPRATELLERPRKSPAIGQATLRPRLVETRLEVLNQAARGTDPCWAENTRILRHFREIEHAQGVSRVPG